MIILKIIIWSVVIILLLIFLHFFFLPYIKNKLTFWIMSKRINKMAKKYDGELGEKLNELANALRDLSKSEKLFDDEGKQTNK